MSELNFDEVPIPSDDVEFLHGNQYVESLGGRDLLEKDDTQAVFNPVDNNSEQNDTDYEEQRRVAALSTAQTLGLTNVGELLLAAVQIEQFLKDGVIEYTPSTPAQAAGEAQEALEGAPGVQEPDTSTGR